MFVLPEKVEICGFTFTVEETDDTEKLGGDSIGFWNAVTKEIYIKKSLSLEQKAETFMHEFGEVILRSVVGVRKADFSEKDWDACIRLFYATIVRNSLHFGD